MLETTHNREDAESMAWDLEGGTEKGEQRKENEIQKSHKGKSTHNWSPEEENQKNGTEKKM